MFSFIKPDPNVFLGFCSPRADEAVALSVLGTSWGLAWGSGSSVPYKREAGTLDAPPCPPQGRYSPTGGGRLKTAEHREARECTSTVQTITTQESALKEQKR